MSQKRTQSELAPLKDKASRVAYLVCVTGSTDEAQSGHNKFYNLYIIDGDTWIEYGRVDASITVEFETGTRYFESKLREKTTRKKNAYTDITHLKAGQTQTVKGQTSNGFQPIPDKSVARLMDALMGASKRTVQVNYKVAVEAVTEAMMKEAQGFLDELAQLSQRQASIDTLNRVLLNLYTVLPRKMNKVQDYLINNQAEVQRFLASEQSILDSLAGQVVTTQAQNHGAGTLLEALGITVEPTTAAQHQALLDRMQDAITPVNWTNEVYSVTGSWVVRNLKTETALKNHVAGRPNQTTMLLWHGSRSENWLSILEAGLLIKPAGAHTSGSRFGDGVYHSDTPRKSIGYTSIEGSYWAGGNGTKAYMGLYEVHTGKEKTVTSGNHGLNARNIDPADSVFVPKDPPYQYNTERVTYLTAQSTVRFILEINRVK